MTWTTQDLEAWAAQRPGTCAVCPAAIYKFSKWFCMIHANDYIHEKLTDSSVKLPAWVEARLALPMNPYFNAAPRVFAPIVHQCKRCGLPNEYQPGPYTCFQCRQDPWR